MTAWRPVNHHRKAAGRTLDRVAAARKKKPYKIVFESVTQEKKKLRSAVSYRSDAPLGYTFVPAGTPDLTERCKELCRTKGLRVHVVSATPRSKAHENPEKISHHIHRIGYHFPNQVVDSACDWLGYTHHGGVFRKDLDRWHSSRLARTLDSHSKRLGLDRGNRSALETQEQISAAIRDLFPKIPAEDLASIVKHAFREGAGRIGSADLPLARRVQLAVLAHIRHTYTNYDRLLKSGTYLDARAKVEQACLDQLMKWRGENESDAVELEDIFREVIVIDDSDEEVDEESDFVDSEREASLEILESQATAHELAPDNPVDMYRSDPRDGHHAPSRFYFVERPRRVVTAPRRDTYVSQQERLRYPEAQTNRPSASHSSAYSTLQHRPPLAANPIRRSSFAPISGSILEQQASGRYAPDPRIHRSPELRPTQPYRRSSDEVYLSRRDYTAALVSNPPTRIHGDRVFVETSRGTQSQLTSPRRAADCHVERFGTETEKVVPSIESDQHGMRPDRAIAGTDRQMHGQDLPYPLYDRQSRPNTQHNRRSWPPQREPDAIYAAAKRPRYDPYESVTYVPKAPADEARYTTHSYVSAQQPAATCVEIDLTNSSPRRGADPRDLYYSTGSYREHIDRSMNLAGNHIRGAQTVLPPGETRPQSTYQLQESASARNGVHAELHEHMPSVVDHGPYQRSTAGQLSILRRDSRPIDYIDQPREMPARPISYFEPVRLTTSRPNATQPRTYGTSSEPDRHQPSSREMSDGEQIHTAEDGTEKPRGFPAVNTLDLNTTEQLSNTGFVVPKRLIRTVKLAMEQNGVLQDLVKVKPYKELDKQSDTGERSIIYSTIPEPSPESWDQAIQSTLAALGLAEYRKEVRVECFLPSELKSMTKDGGNTLVTAVHTWFGELPARTSTNVKLEDLQSTLPTSYTIYPPMLLLPERSFKGSLWDELLAREKDRSRLFANVAQKLGVTHIARNAPISLMFNGAQADPSDPQPNILRSPALTPLFGDFGPVLIDCEPTSEDFDQTLWVSTRQNGIEQCWAPAHTMFSRGNVREKARLKHLPSVLSAVGEGREESIPGCTAVDLYAGIGYFAFSYVAAGVTKVLCWELNPWSVEGLRRGAAKNHWTVVSGPTDTVDIVMRAAFQGPTGLFVYEETNEMAGDRIEKARVFLPPIRHVNCGLLPSSRGSWRTAVAALDPERGGWIHIHENLASSRLEELARRVLNEIRDIAKDVQEERDAAPRSTSAEGGKEMKLDAELEHVEKVKSYAPGVEHCVLDVKVTPRLLHEEADFEAEVVNGWTVMKMSRR